MGNRPETGPMQFGDDWPGVFIRGDNAGYMAFSLGEILDHLDSKGSPVHLTPFQVSLLREIQNLLSGSNAFEGAVPPTLLLPFKECEKK